MRGVGQDAPHADPQAGSASLASPSAPTPHSLSPYSPLEQAILSIKVLDYATGSGHMLIGAARRLAHHLARIRTGDDEPGPDHVRSALRDVVRHCIYGVDVNETSVELCKVALWMETLEPGKPLGFLDAHIRHGNSLIGVTSLDELDAGIPDDAYSAKTGDDKAAAAALKKRNRKERESLQAGLFETHPEDDLLKEWRDFQAAPEETPQQIAAKSAAYDALRREGGRWDQLRTACHLWTAAFFAEYTGDKRTDERIATTADLRAYLAQPQTASRAQAAYARKLAARHAFFHWSLAFPEVYRQGGFDVILSNPPWERIKLQEKEWFAARAPAIANAPNAAARRSLIAQLAKEDPALYAEFEADKHGAESESQFVRISDRYPLCGAGDVNTYAVFAELASHLTNDQGKAGIIVQSDIATADTYKEFIAYLLEEHLLASFYDFVNTEGIFPAIHRTHPHFCLMTIRGRASHESTDFSFWNTNVTHLQERTRHFHLSFGDLTLLNPNTRTIPVFRTQRDAELTKWIYRRVPALVIEGAEQVNPWGIVVRRIFDMNRQDVLSKCILGSVHPAPPGYTKMYESKLMHQFDHRWATYDGDQVTSLNLVEKLDPTHLVLPRFHAEQREVALRISQYWGYPWLVAWRDITNSTNERSVIASIIPFSATDFTLRIGFPQIGEAEEIVSLVGNLNSFCFDYLARQKLSGTHLSDYILKQLPVLPPLTYRGIPGWTEVSANQTLGQWLSARLLELLYTAWDLEPLARDCGYDGPPFRWDEARRFLLRCELDAAYFHLYGIERDDVAYILETFPIVKRKDLAAHGEYRTQRVILEIYDEMAEAMASGVPYRTRLDPPPADPRVAHRPKGVGR